MKIFIYTRAVNVSTPGGAEHQRNSQIVACTQAGLLAGLPSRRDSDGEPKLLNAVIMPEPLSGSDRIWTQVIDLLEPVDCLIVASLSVFGEVPTRMIAHLSQAIATGCKLIVADTANLDVQLIRQVALSFSDLETKADRLQAEIDGIYATRSEERRQFMKDAQRRMIDLLFAKGIDLSELLTDDGKASELTDDPIRGRNIRRIREELGITAEMAGRLVLSVGGEKPLGKGEVSAIETGKLGGAKADLYEIAVKAEHGRRKRDAQMDKAIVKSSAPGGGQPLTPGEVEYMQKVVRPAQTQQQEQVK